MPIDKQYNITVQDEIKVLLYMMTSLRQTLSRFSTASLHLPDFTVQLGDVTQRTGRNDSKWDTYNKLNG